MFKSQDNFSIDVGFWYANVGRTLGQASRTTITSVLRDRTPAPPEREPEPAEISWGGPANFEWGVAEDFSTGPNIRFAERQDEDEEAVEEPYQDIEVWEEHSRQERDVRVEGTNGAYVDFKRLDEITWRLPDLNGVQRFVVQRFKKFGDE
jgi:hypothetical protein